MAGDFVPAQDPFLPAPIEDHYIAATGTALKVIKFNPGVLSAASIAFSNRWIAKPGTPFYTVNVQVNAFTDNASLNDFSFKIHTYSGGFPAGVYNSALTASAAYTAAGLGAYKVLRGIFQFTTTGDNLILCLERQTAADSNPGTIYVPSILLYFNVALS
jgi:hypothetical protein